MAELSYVIVKKGDTLSGIAKTHRGSASKYKELAAINDIENPDLIYVGQKIYLYSKDAQGTTKKTSSSNCPTINHFGEISNKQNELFVTWKWSKSNTESYKIQWSYYTGDGVWFSGSNSTITIDSDDPSISRQSTYNIPDNATQVRFKVKPISKKKKDKKGNETSYWTANWSDVKKATWKRSQDNPTTPSAPNVTIDGYKLTATLSGIDITGATGIKFRIIKQSNQNKTYKSSDVVTIPMTKEVSYSCNVAAGDAYKVQCKAYNKNNKLYSEEWSPLSSSWVKTPPAAPGGITKIQGKSKTSVVLAWDKSTAATGYTIQYTHDKGYFTTPSSDQPKTQDTETTSFEVTGLESGKEYFFRVRAKNDAGESKWTGIKSVKIGTKPEAPTTWSSTSTAIKGEDVTLYWMHNSEDGSKEVKADVELNINGTVTIKTLTNTSQDEDDNTARSYALDTSGYTDGAVIKWRVRTYGITGESGDWSTSREIEVHVPPTQTLHVTDKSGNDLDEINTFPFYIRASAEPKSQNPIGYHLTITSDESYETVDNVGNVKTVSEGEQIYSKHFDRLGAEKDLVVEFSAGNIDLENNVSYTVTSTVSMGSGLTNETSTRFTVSWTEMTYEPNAEIGIDNDTMTASIRPYCHDIQDVIYKVTKSGTTYVKTSTVLDRVWGRVLSRVKTKTGEQVYEGVIPTDGDDDENVYYCHGEKKTVITDVWLSVYRREFDGSFTELASKLDGAKTTTITDPHPALDFARYRIVAEHKATGAVSYYDPPGHPVNGTAVIIQWDDEWSIFETVEDETPEQPPWTGSLLRLPYNIDVSDSHNPDVEMVEYIGREHPVSYYGTQLGATSTWNVEIEKNDEETLYGLRRLARWMGDAYVREPSGSGYWANIVVSFNQTHCKPTIPVSLTITRVEGGA